MKMKIFLDSKNKRRTLTLFIQKRLNESLGAHLPYVRTVDVRVRDLNGPKGGVDKECKIVLRRPSGQPLVVRAVQSHPARAFREALRRLVYALREQMRRKDVVKRSTRTHFSRHIVPGY